ncbi:hypothetical protein Tco_0014921 [Tanacetum coccineum]
MDKKFFSSKASGKPPRDTLVNRRNNENDTRQASSYHSYSQSPPYDYQYKERRYRKQAPALAKNPGSDRGMFRFLSTSRLSDHVQEDMFANEVSNPRASDYSATNGGDLFRSGTQSPPSLSQSSGSGKFDGLDLFSAPNQPPSTTPAPAPLSQSSGSGKFNGLDLFNVPNQPPSTTPAPAPLSQSLGSGKFGCISLDPFTHVTPNGETSPKFYLFASPPTDASYLAIDFFAAPGKVVAPEMKPAESNIQSPKKGASDGFE